MTETSWHLLRKVSHQDKKNPRGLFRCECGNEKVVCVGHVRSGKSKSCGCKGDGRFKIKHGATKSPEYASWRGMIKRCTYPKDKEFNRYKDIPIHPEWRNSFASFFNDVGPKTTGTTLDRINNSKGYLPGNVRWADRKTQSVNRSCAFWLTDGQEVLCAADMARKHGVSPRTIKRWVVSKKNNIERARD